MARTRRAISLLLIWCMALGLLPNMAFAAADTGSFTDVKETDWFYEDVAYVCEHDMMNGTSATEFSPELTTTRAMIVTILHRLEGTPQVSAASFSDVPEGTYYTEAVAWAAENGIVNGYKNGLFGPDDNITREQMAAILYRYSNYKGYDMAVSGDISTFTDAVHINSYAAEAMQWANAKGLITGVTATTLEPQGNATRAQVAAILNRFCKNIVPAGQQNKPSDEVKSYTVTFNLNYGSNDTYQTATVNEGNTTKKPSDPTRTGYTFNGWYKEKTGGTAFDFAEKITGDITLYAHWTIKSSGGGSSGSGGGKETYTVTFEFNDGRKVEGKEIKSGDKVSKPTDPTKDGYKFIGWYTDNNTFKNAYDFNTAVTGKLTLYANWQKNTDAETYTVTFDFNDDREAESKEIKSGDKVTEPTDPTKDGYVFIGWYTDNGTFENSYNFDTAVTGKLTLYARWQEIIGNKEDSYISVPNEKNIEIESDSGIMYINNEILIHAKQGTERSDVVALVEKYNGEIVGEIPTTDTYQVRLLQIFDKYNDITELQTKLKSEAIVNRTSPNLVFGEASNYFPTEGTDWNTNLKYHWGAKAIKAPNAWEYLDYMEPVNIGIYDSSFYRNEDLTNIKETYENDLNKESAPDMHGTHVAGIIGAMFNNNKGIAGTFPVANIFGYASIGSMCLIEKENIMLGWKWLPKSCFCSAAYYKALTQLIAPKDKNKECKVINISKTTGDLIGFSASQGNEDAKSYIAKYAECAGEYLQDLIDRNYDFVICMSAGNGGEYKYKKDSVERFGFVQDNSGTYSGDADAKYNHFLNAIERTAYQDVYDRIIVVGACQYNKDVDQNGYCNFNSPPNYSYASYSDTGKRVDVVAPGSEIYSTIDSGYAIKDGTSMSCPYVAGLAGMLFSLNPDIKGSDVKRIICTTANIDVDCSTARTKDTLFRKKMVNAADAVKAVRPDLGFVTGKVFNSANIPLEGATVRFRSGKNSMSGSYIMDPADSTKPLEVRTDKNGYYSTEKLFQKGVKNNYTAEASKLWYDNTYQNFTVDSAGVTPVPDIELKSAQPEYAISGTVQSKDPTLTLINVQVKFKDGTGAYLKDDNGDLTLSLKLNEEGTSGTFTHMLPTGSYTLEVSGTGFITASEAFEVTTTGMQLRLIMLEPGSSEDPPEPVIVDSGVCGKNGDNLTWTLYDNGLLKISGSGEMADFNTPPTWEKYKSSIKSVEMEDGIITVGKNAFKSYENLTQVKLSESLKSIGSYAFCACGITEITIPDSVTELASNCFSSSSLTSVTIPDGVTSIEQVFQRCKKLTTVNISESVTNIKEAFLGCIRLTSVNIPSEITEIEGAAFRGCSGLQSITIPDKVKIIGSDAFRGCSSLAEITIPDSVTSIGGHAFDNCPISSIIIPDGVTKLENATFFECKNLTDVKLPNSITSIGSQTFSECGFTTITLPESLKSIGYSAFNDCENLTNIVIPDSVKSIDIQVFNRCHRLKSVKLPAELPSISKSLFINCENLSEIVIPKSVTKIGSAAFQGCNALTTVQYGGSETDKNNLVKSIEYGNEKLIQANWICNG